MPGKRRRREHGTDGDDIVLPKKITGKELSDVEELRAQLMTLVEMLDEKGIIDKDRYRRVAAMHLHEISKAGAIEELDEEL